MNSIVSKWFLSKNIESTWIALVEFKIAMNLKRFVRWYGVENRFYLNQIYVSLRRSMGINVWEMCVTKWNRKKRCRVFATSSMLDASHRPTEDVANLIVHFNRMHLTQSPYPVCIVQFSFCLSEHVCVCLRQMLMLAGCKCV